MIRLALAAALLVGCRAAPPPRSLATPEAVAPSLPPPTSIGACDPTEYYVFRKQPGEAQFRVTLDGDGRPTAVDPASSTGLEPDEMPLATDIARHVFRCRNRLAADAPREVTYTQRYAPLQLAGVDAAACGKAVTYPFTAEVRAVEADVRAGVALDARGHVDVAWVDRKSAFGFADAAVDALAHHCHFTPARSSEGPVPFFLVYRFHFLLPR